MNIAPQKVRAQLQKILESDSFARSRRMQRFLEFIVEETLAGRPDGLGEYGIGVSVFDRDPDFEPALDPIVRNDARRLRAKLLEYYRDHQPGSFDGVLIEMPKGGYVPVFRSLASRVERGRAEEERIPRLAVLPFEVCSGAPQAAEYARAFCMSLTASLTGLEGLDAVAHGYVPELPLREAASQLGLTHVIHGSVLESSGCYRLTVNLIQAQAATQLWAREYDVEGDELFRQQTEIARTMRREVAARLGLRLSQPPALAMAA
jgi:serine/threonine-protein kinase